MNRSEWKPYASNITWVYCSEELDAILEEILFTHLKEINQLRTIAAFSSTSQYFAEDKLPKHKPITK
jgi:hypothetical protein